MEVREVGDTDFAEPGQETLAVDRAVDRAVGLRKDYGEMCKVWASAEE